jgi:hypothetical protein
VLAIHGVHGQDEEGGMYYSASQATMRAEFGGLVGDVSRRTLDMLVVEERIRVGDDGGVSISWAELAKRLAAADDLIERRPVLLADSLIKDLYHGYLLAYLGTWPNSPGFDFDPPHKVLSDLRVSWTQYAAEHPATRSGRAVQEYLTALKANNWERPKDMDSLIQRLVPPG